MQNLTSSSLVDTKEACRNEPKTDNTMSFQVASLGLNNSPTIQLTAWDAW